MMRLLSALLLLCACTVKVDDGYFDAAPFDPNRPDQPGDRNVAPYTGSDSDVLLAQETRYDGHALHTNVIQRSCSGVAGVCHNQKEYPDMRTSGTFLATIGAACNVNAKFYTTVFNRCELPGDKFELESGIPPAEIAYIEWIKGPPGNDDPPTATSKGLHIYLRQPLAAEVGSRNRNVNFWRRLNDNGQVRDVVFSQYRAQWWVLDPNHVMAEVEEDEAQAVEALLASGIRQGDANRDGTFGADNANLISMINPGKPDESYLVGRLRGTIQGESVPGTRMPLANLVPTVPDMLALMCFIEGLPTDGSPVDLSWPIDYANCSYINDPQALSLTGVSGATWSGRVWPLLQSKCGGCHGGATPSAALDLIDSTAYQTLLGPSTQNTSLNFVEPGFPGSSYLYQKLTDDPGILGEPMPQDPITGYEPLTAQELMDVSDWITQGALEN